MNRIFLLSLLSILFLMPSHAISKVISSDTTWSGEMSIDENILVPEGVTLTIAPGTVIRVAPSEGSKTDPEFISYLTEITVRGSLVADGKEDSPVTFLSSGTGGSAWAGIIVDGGKALLRSCVIRDAETGIDVVKGSAVLSDSRLTGNRYGLTVQGHEAAVRVSGTQINENDYGIFLLNGARIESKDIIVEGNRKKNSYSSAAKEYYPLLKEYKVQVGGESKVYDDAVFFGTVVWQGRIAVNGTIRVPVDSRLIILPGTLVEFSRKDTNGDGIGENGLLVQGTIIAKGTSGNPILFRSAEKQKGMSDWDSINILGSDASQNLIEYCQIENAYRGMHFHFSNVAVKDAVLRNNARGIQFQESLVEISGTHFYGNGSALWARDSEIMFHDNLIYRNYSGINFFRDTLDFRKNTILNNARGGLRIREGIPIVEKNLIDGNRYGLLVVDALYGSFSGNVVTHNLESGIALRGPLNIEISGSIIQNNGLYGISIQDSSAVIKDNLIADNGERGIGIISFHGLITGNSIVRNGLYNLGIEGPSDVAAPSNWWGAGDIKSGIYDKEDDQTKGAAAYLPALKKAVAVTWPLQTVQTDAAWRDTIRVGGIVTVDAGTNLSILPGASVLFDKDAGLVVKGRIRAQGEKDAPVTFSSLNNDAPGAWDEIRLEHADGSIFSDCVIRNATWALHVHFSNFTMERCALLNNYGGMRFRSGPMEVRNSLFSGNEIGLRSNRGIALITDSVITGNRIGIFVREKGGGLKITKNNLFANSDYNIRVGDFNDEDVQAAENWWGDVMPADTIFDARNEPGIGTVQYEPPAEKPFVAVGFPVLSDALQSPPVQTLREGGEQR